MANDSKLQAFLSDLLTLEVTTVVLDEIPSHVALDVKRQVAETGARMAARHRRHLERSRPDALEGAESASGASRRRARAGKEPAEGTSLKAVFQGIADSGVEDGSGSADEAEEAVARAPRAKASAALEGQPALPPEDQPAHARRVERARVLAELLPDSDAELEELAVDRRMALRRMATLADYPIALHTTLSVSGDLMNLCASAHTGPEGAAIRALHAEGVANAIGWWKSLAQAVAGFLGLVLETITRAGRPGGGS